MRALHRIVGVLVVSAATVLAVPAYGLETEQEQRRGWALAVDGKRLFSHNFLCVRAGATDAQDVFVLKPKPVLTRQQALATLGDAGLPSTVEYRLKFQYTADVAGLARAIAREEPVPFRTLAHVGPQIARQIAWTPGGSCPRVGINVPPPTDPAAFAWAQATAAKYGADRVDAVHEPIVQAMRDSFGG